jgi:predicted Zn-dependent protease
VSQQYHKRMRFSRRLGAVFTALLWLTLALTPRALAQGALLPDLGGSDRADLSPQAERRIGETIMRDARADPAYVDDPEVDDYLNSLGARLSAAAPGARHDFEFFALRDATVNAFALPGGFIGVHTGLVTVTENESELASVLAHEIGHVTQRHIARLLGAQQRMQIPILAALAAAILMARSNPELAAAASTAAQAGGVQAQINYTRDFEREADSVGFQTLSAAGFDVRGMAQMFDLMQKTMRIADDGTVPGYLRTHPLNTERVANAQNRAASVPYRQHTDSVDYQLVRAKLRAEAGDSADAVSHFAALLRDRRFASEAGTRYGYAVALLRAKRPRDAQTEIAALRSLKIASPLVETLAARVAEALGDNAAALAILAKARAAYPYRRPLVYAQVVALQHAGRNEEALAVLAEQVRLYPRDGRLLALQSRAYAALGKRLLQHQVQAEVYLLQGSMPAAIEQLQLAQRAGDGDFYQLSVIDARLRELRARQAQERQEERALR